MAGRRDRDGFWAKLSARSAPPGWRHRKFWTRSPMSMAFAIKDGVPSMRFETHDSASMLFRDVDIDLAAYPMLTWRWYIELPIRSPLDERTREGDDHPARLLLRFITDGGEKRAMEVIWGNRLDPGDYKYIAGFPHFVADAGDDRVGHWLDERIDLAASMPRSGRMPRRRTWSTSPCSATATTRTPPASAISPMSGSNGDEPHAGALGRVKENGDENGSANHRLVFGGAGPLYRWLRARTKGRSHRLQGR